MPAKRSPIFAVQGILACLLVLACVQAPAHAQEPVQPVMENVFFNVVWGSAFGATLGVAVAVLGSEDKSAPDNARSGAFSGATAGGLIGLGVALYLVYQGVTFDPASSQIGAAPVPPQPPPRFHAELAPFALLTSAERPGHVVGFAARVIDLRF